MKRPSVGQVIKNPPYWFRFKRDEKGERALPAWAFDFVGVCRCSCCPDFKVTVPAVLWGNPERWRWDVITFPSRSRALAFAGDLCQRYSTTERPLFVLDSWGWPEHSVEQSKRIGGKCLARSSGQITIGFLAALLVLDAVFFAFLMACLWGR